MIEDKDINNKDNKINYKVLPIRSNNNN